MDYGMLPRYADASLSKLHKAASDDIKKLLRKVAVTKKEAFYKNALNLFIYGSYRVGKTWLLHAIMNHVIKTFKDNSVYYVTSPQLSDFAMKRNLVPGFDELWIDHLSRIRVLMLDDLGQEYRGSNSGFSEFNIEKFLRFRFNHRAITYISSNCNPTVEKESSSLSNLYGESLATFIQSEFVLYEVDGINMSAKIMSEKF